ncbi:hypothetical protein SRHO_G00275660 [Serrasalmus rhombeus]
MRHNPKPVRRDVIHEYQACSNSKKNIQQWLSDQGLTFMKQQKMRDHPVLICHLFLYTLSVSLSSSVRLIFLTNSPSQFISRRQAGPRETFSLAMSVMSGRVNVILLCLARSQRTRGRLYCGLARRSALTKRCAQRKAFYTPGARHCLLRSRL